MRLKRQINRWLSGSYVRARYVFIRNLSSCSQPIYRYIRIYAYIYVYICVYIYIYSLNLHSQSSSLDPNMVDVRACESLTRLLVEIFRARVRH